MFYKHAFFDVSIDFVTRIYFYGKFSLMQGCAALKFTSRIASKMKMHNMFQLNELKQRRQHYGKNVHPYMYYIHAVSRSPV